ncbi:trimethylamine methyltransferase family protein [Pseudoflavonifractor phocaeensis]|uniref:trimethylamine methyltransferase family protein n=1 Tax=Pseudoflavonifractor phocaeensis TaxID=1870988 RepID=UPI00210D712A|nr:trimethylamine methyltransferase family protein [Pseudoflavonifractor phocaeensis]MCQ4864260.1 trimethylamine methyltransferase family protein [Pseudoflavonifractor phocaeensis]
MVGRIKYNVMNDQELQHMKSRLEQLLIERGIHLDHEEMLADLAKLGCVVDMENKDVKFTKELIDKAVAAIPEKFTLYSPGGKNDLTFPHPEGKFYTRTNTGAPNYRTVKGDTHYTTLEEVDEWYKLTNAMENIDYVTLPSTSGEYVPGDAVDVYTLEKALKHSAKHIWIQPYESDNVQWLIDMAAAAVGGHDKLREKPIVSFIACGVPSLTFKHMDAEVLYRCAKAGVPVQPCSLPTAGANTPVTAQGTAFIACAEVFAMIIMLELLCPGLPVIATTLLFSMDMQTTYTLQSNTQITIARLICMELFERGYNIRAHSYGTGTDSLTMDAQNFIERTNLIDAMAMSEASVLGGAGQLETAKTISPLQLIIDNEIFGIAQRIRCGLAVDDETLDWDELIAGMDKDPAFSFLMSEHTFRHYAEPHRPDMFNRDGLVRWEQEGSKTLTDKALEKFEAIMAAEDTYALSADKAAEVEKVLKQAHAALVK